MNKPIDVLMAPEADLPIDANPAAFVAASGDGVVVPDAQLLFTADFVRSGHDLKLIGNDGAEVVIPEYFSNAIAPALTAPNGAMIGGETVSLLAGPQFPGQYAQASPSPDTQPASTIQWLGRTNP